MSVIITSADLDGLSEQELLALHARILSDLGRVSRFVPECPHIRASLRNVEEALARVRQCVPRPPRGPGL